LSRIVPTARCCTCAGRDGNGKTRPAFQSLVSFSLCRPHTHSHTPSHRAGAQQQLTHHPMRVEAWLTRGRQEPSTEVETTPSQKLQCAGCVCVCEKPALTHHVIAFFSPCDPLAHITACVRVAPQRTTMNAYTAHCGRRGAGSTTPPHRTQLHSPPPLQHAKFSALQAAFEFPPKNVASKDRKRLQLFKGSSHAFSLSCWH